MSWKPKSRATDDGAHTGETSSARRALTETSQWLVHDLGTPKLPDMLAIPESAWQRGARMARTPAFGVAVAAYLFSAWVVVGAATSPPLGHDSDEFGTTASDADTWPQMAPNPDSDGTPGTRGVEEMRGNAPAPIDAQNFASLQQVLSNVDAQGSSGQLAAYGPQGPEPPSMYLDLLQHGPLPGPAPDAPVDEASAIAGALPAADPNAPLPGPPPVETPVPEAVAVAPVTAPVAAPTASVAVPTAQTAAAPAVETPAPEAVAVAPVTPTVAAPTAPTAEVPVVQPQLGPAPGPAA